MPQKGPKKRKCIPLPTDYSNVLDFVNLSANTEYNQSIIQKIELSSPVKSQYFNDISSYYSIKDLPGEHFIFLKSSPFQDSL